MSEPETPFDALKRMGASRVRYYVATDSLTQPLKKQAIEWLGQLDDAERERIAACNLSQARIALSAKKAATIAAIAAIIANMIAIIGVIIALLAWEFPKH